MEKPCIGSVMVVDDDPEMRGMLTDYLRRQSYKVTEFENGLSAAQFMSSNKPEALQIEVILSDLRMPDFSGIDLLQQVRRCKNPCPVIIMTAFASVDTALDGLRKGAFDYITKPFKLGEMLLNLERALGYQRLKAQNLVLTSEVKKNWIRQNVVGKSSAMQDIFDVLERVAPATSSILITGESGTGKEVVARALHQMSPRAQGPFIAINCTAIPDELLESELFGHVKGSFTGAVADKKGLFEEAHGGTLFLDEIGDMELSLQAKLLRVLQERLIRPVGSNQSKAIDVRLVAATHKDLKKSIANESFREDLYFRLAVIPIFVPPLRHRTEDIPLLAQHFLNKYVALNNREGQVIGFTQTAMEQLLHLPWPGNVRELENCVERCVVMTRGPQIDVHDLPKLESTSFENFFGQSTADMPTLEQLEERYITLVLAKTGGKKEKAAQILGVNRRTLYRREQTS
jgi:two-component system response regulator HydG